MGTPEEIAEKEVEIATVKAAIKNGFLLGNRYKVESAKSNREFEGFTLPQMREYLVFLQSELKTLKGNQGWQGLF